MKVYKCDNGKYYRAHQKFCIFCKHCSDIFWDYSHGPYMFCCELGVESCENCNAFEEDLENPDIMEVEKMIKLNGVLPEKAEEIEKVFPDISHTEPDLDDGLVDVYVPTFLPIAINYNQVTKFLALVAWDDAEKQVVLSSDDFVVFKIV